MSVNLALRLNGTKLELYNSDTGQLAAKVPASISSSWDATQIGTLTGSSDESSAASVIHQASVTLNNAAIIALPTTFATLTGAPSATRLVLPVGVTLITDFAAGYTGADVVGADMGIYWSNGNVWGGLIQNDNTLTPSVSDLTSLLSAASFARKFTRIPPFRRTATAEGGETYPLATSDDLDVSIGCGLILYVTNGLNFGGGNAVNTLTVNVEFRVLNVSSGLELTTDESGWNESTRTFA